MSRKLVPKPKGGIPLAELLAAPVASDARLNGLRARHGKAAAPASTNVPKPSKRPKRAKTASRKAPKARLADPGDSQFIEIGSPRLVGYARVSTDEQTTALQLDALRAAACAVIHEDWASGAARSRPGLERAIEDLVAGDTLVVWRLDRLGRSLRDLLDISEMLREREVALRWLTDHIDTGTAVGRMLYGVLGAVAQFERYVLRERTVSGLAAAKRRGETLGRPPALTPAQVREAKRMLARGERPNYVARISRVERSTLYRAIA